jgi:ppGpp synthetase/RelA/SpoT-type nucleotidyltranferase
MRKIVKENKNFEKDLNTGALINRNLKLYDAIKKRKEEKRKKEKEVDDLKSQVKTLTSLVEKLAKKIDK